MARRGERHRHDRLKVEAVLGDDRVLLAVVARSSLAPLRIVACFFEAGERELASEDCDRQDIVSFCDHFAWGESSIECVLPPPASEAWVLLRRSIDSGCCDVAAEPDAACDGMALAALAHSRQPPPAEV